MATTVGEAVIKLKFDGSGLASGMKLAVSSAEKSGSSEAESSGKKTGGIWSNAVTLAAGNLLSKGLSSIMSKATSQIDSAISRVDTLEQFPKVMRNIGVSSSDAEAVIKSLSSSLKGLPTRLDDAAAAVQRLTLQNNDVKKSEQYFVALNNALLGGTTNTELQASALEQLTQAYSKGKPDMLEWRSLQQAMGPALQQTARELGYTQNGLVDAGQATVIMGEELRKGELSMDTFMDTLVKLNTEGTEGFPTLEQQARDMSGGISTAMSNMDAAITRGWQSIIEAIGSDRINEIADRIGGAFEQVGKAIGGVIQFILDNEWVLGVITAAIGGLMALGIAGKVGRLVQNLSSLQPILGVITKVLGNMVGNTFVKILTFGRTLLAGIPKLFALVMANPIVLVIAGIIAAIILVLTHLEEIGQFVEFLGGVFTEIFTNIGEFVTGVFTNIGEFVKSVFSGIKNFATNVFNGIKSAVQALGNFFKSVFTNAFNAIKGVFSKLLGFFGGIFNGIKNIFIKIGQTVGNIVGGAFKGVVNGVLSIAENIINAPIRAINGLISVINNIPGVNLGRIGEWHLPRMAEGGIVSGATTAIIGEAGKEAVLPLENNTGNWAGLLASAISEQMEVQGVGGREIVVNMTNNIDSRLDAEDIGRVLMQSIRRAA